MDKYCNIIIDSIVKCQKYHISYFEIIIFKKYSIGFEVRNSQSIFHQDYMILEQ